MKRKMAIVACMVLMTSLFSCAGATKQQQAAGTGALIGSGVGAILGAAIGGDAGSTIAGAGIGAMAGAITGDRIGAYMDRQEQELRQALAASEARSASQVEQVRAASQAAVVQRTDEVLTATFRSEVLFDFDSDRLKPGAEREMDRVADVLNRYPQTRIRVEGHTDATGSEQYNRDLSHRRARAVKDALVSRGVAFERIEAVGYGESEPVGSENAMNRRVVIVIQPMAAG